MGERIYLNRDWTFSSEFNDSMIKSPIEKGEIVSIPHSVVTTPFNYFDESIYQMVSCYQKIITYDESWTGKVIYLTFEGVAHKADVYVNGKLLVTNENGYNAFTCQVTDTLVEGDNIITVKCDSNESLNQPPFGFVVDYMTYGGIYRDIYIDVKDPVHIKDAFYQPMPIFDSIKKLDAEAISSFTCSGHLITELEISSKAASYIKGDHLIVRQSLDDKVVAEMPLTSEMKFTVPLSDIKIWDVESPNLYTVTTELVVDGQVKDSHSFEIGFRKAEFKSDGFYLNGRKLKICGLNRHQSYPYVGYAMPESMQREDARILKEELGCNAVRTSHYSQAHSFTNECDRLGLLQVTEFPGWQHIGDQEWKEVAKKNCAQMIREFRNHPSIILWGVRINESADDEEFYKATNALAHKLDPTRQTSGTKALVKMQTFEDVYTYNDFKHNGTNEGCTLKKDVVPKEQQEIPYLVTEYNGHMYPTKSYDCEEHRRDHMLRHANVLDAIAGQDDIAGSFGWCMFDYNTHKDFGSGDRICYHGVMDMFRNPKYAAELYAAQSNKTDVLKLCSTMDVGEHPECNRGRSYILSNFDSVKMYKNGSLLKEYKPEDSEYKNLKHGPILLDKFVADGDMKKEEGWSDDQVAKVSGLLDWAALHGWSNLMQWDCIKYAVPIVLKYHMNPSEAVPLFQHYVGDWGGESAEYTLEGIRDGQVVKTSKVGTARKIHLDTQVSSNKLVETKTYDVAAVRIQAKDEYDNLVPYYQEAVVATVEGDIEVIGPQVITLRGGMAGLYVKSKGKSGKGKITLLAQNIEKAVEIPFEVEIN